MGLAAFMRAAESCVTSAASSLFGGGVAPVTPFF